MKQFSTYNGSTLRCLIISVCLLLGMLSYASSAVADSGDEKKERSQQTCLDAQLCRSSDRLELNEMLSVFADYRENSRQNSLLSRSCLGRKTEIDDSLEGMNRVFFVGNDVLILWFFRPVMKTYFCIVPKTARKSINNMSINVEVPARSLSCLLQGRCYDSTIVVWRFLINTVLGVGGAYDIAEEQFGIRRRDEDMGQAFASWGIGSGCYLYVFILGPSSIRDAVGTMFDYALDPKTYAPVPGVQSFATFNKAALHLDDYVKLVDSFDDPYKILQTLWYIQRRVKIYIDR